MELKQARVLVCGASGAIGGALARELHDAGATVVAAGRDAGRVGEAAAACGTDPIEFDVVDVESCAATVSAAVEQLGGLDLLVVTVGAPAFARGVELDDAVAEELFAVNVLGPMALVRAAAPHLQGGTAVVVSAILADLPTAGMADYSAAKSALSVWLGVVRKEERRTMRVIDVRPPHLDTGMEGRPLAGTAPRLPQPFAAAKVVAAVLQAVRDDASTVTLVEGELAVR